MLRDNFPQEGCWNFGKQQIAIAKRTVTYNHSRIENLTLSNSSKLYEAEYHFL
jgi:hypothetical protein